MGSIIELREVHPENAPDPIVVTESGRVIEVREVQPEKAFKPIELTV